MKRVKCLDCHVSGWWLLGGMIVLVRHLRGCPADTYVEQR